MATAEQIKIEFPLHWLVWNNSYQELQEEISKKVVRFSILILNYIFDYTYILAPSFLIPPSDEQPPWYQIVFFFKINYCNMRRIIYTEFYVKSMCINSHCKET